MHWYRHTHAHAHAHACTHACMHACWRVRKGFRQWRKAGYWLGSSWVVSGTGTLTLSAVFIKTQPLPSLPLTLFMRTFLSQCLTKSFPTGHCWLVAAFLPGLTGRAMMSAFLFSAHCQPRWLSQRKHQGKVAQHGWCAITECGCW